VNENSVQDGRPHSRRAFLAAAAVASAAGFAATSESARADSIQSARSNEPSSSDIRRQAAVDWATSNVNTHLIAPFAECTIFVSYCLWAAGFKSSDQWSPLTWPSYLPAVPGPSPTAVNADMLKNYLLDNGLATISEVAWSDNTAGGAQLGDIIGYDWNEPGADGVLDHLAIVTSLNDSGYPSVTQHDPNQASRFWSWSLNENDWIERYYLSQGYEPRVYRLAVNY
jgi:hypothetical protein